MLTPLKKNHIAASNVIKVFVYEIKRDPLLMAMLSRKKLMKT